MNVVINNTTWFMLILFLVLFSCKKKQVGPQKCEDINYSGFDESNFVLIGCEGNFGSSSSSISLYDPIEMDVINSIYNEVNGISPGDVLQSMYAIDNSIFIVMNNSSIILELDKTTLNLVNEINLNNRSPRFMVSSDNGQSFISNFALNPDGEPVYIDVMDNDSRLIVDSINVGVWTEEMVVKNSLLYACGMRGNKIIVIDVNSHDIVDEIEMGVEPTSIVQDINGNIWVLCTGGFEEELPSLWKIDFVNDEISTFLFNNIEDYPTHLKLNGTKDQLFFLNNGVFNMPIGAPQLPIKPLINAEQNYYGLGVDPFSNDIYYSITGDDGSGTVYRYDMIYGDVDNFDVGIFPSSFLFVE